MFRAYIPKGHPNNIWFAADLQGKALLLKVLFRIAMEDIEIDDGVVSADQDIFHCRSDTGHFSILYDGDICIRVPTEELAKKLVEMFNKDTASEGPGMERNR